MSSSADRALAALAGKVEATALRHLQAAAESFEGVLIATDAYGDDTGANRGATFAAAATSERAGVANRKARAALAEAARLNPGLEYAEELELPDGVVRVIGTSMTAYAADLEHDAVGERAYLEDSMLLEAPRLQDAALDAIREVMR
jgi:hypothetical protein